MRVVGRGDWRQAYAGTAAANGIRDGARDFQQQPGAVFNAAAVIVFALVGVAAQKLVEQVAVGAVDFYAIETGGFYRAAGCDLVGVNNARQLLNSKCARL